MLTLMKNWSKAVVSIALDLVYCVIGGQKWTLKHVGLASTWSQDLVKLFNKTGHSLAERTLESLDITTGAILPPNLTPGNFMHYTCDNMDILNGENMFHAKQMAAWQRG